MNHIRVRIKREKLLSSNYSDKHEINRRIGSHIPPMYTIKDYKCYEKNPKHLDFIFEIERIIRNNQYLLWEWVK